MKKMYSLALMLAAVALFMFIVPAHASEMDDRIESSAKKSFVFKTYLNEDDIKIKSKDGAVTLTGSVSEEYHKTLAKETVEGLPGVKSVDNRLAVKNEPPTANSDAWIAGKVKLTLLFHRSVSAVKTEVDVKDGVVTLRGNAESQAQKELATEYAMDVEGVKNVNNEMTAPKTSEKTPKTMGENIDDASITAQVKMSLLLHRSTSALNTTVKTDSGVVTVGGKARNAAEKDLVTKLVEDVKGVTNVKNEMAVE